MVGSVKHGSRPPWVGLAAAVWVQVASGNAYTFPLYSHSLKSVLGFSQQQLTILGVANDMGENVGILPGVVCNRLPAWAVLLVGAVSSFLGFGVLWLALSQTVTSMPYWLLWIALCIATNSSAWLGTGVLVTNMRNFPLSRGAIAGILKGYAGLSAAVLTEAYIGVLQSSSTKLLLLLTIGIPTVCLSMMYFVRPCTPSLEDDSTERGHFLFVQISSIVLGVYLLTSIVVDDVFSVADIVSYIFVGITIIIILAPLAIPLKMTLYPTKPKKTGVTGSSSSRECLSRGEADNIEHLLVESSSTAMLGSFMENDESFDIDILLAEGEGAIKKKRRPRRGEDFRFREAIVKADFWLLFLAYFLGVGSGVTVLNNLAQIGIAVGINDTTILLSLFSFFNFIGRLVGGVVSENFVKSRMLPRPVWMTCTQLLMVLIYLLFAFAPSGVLYVSTALLGLCYGVQFSVMIPTVSELFGLKCFGIIYNFMLLGNPLGAILFSGILAGYVYDKEAARQHRESTNESSSSCLGPECFRLTFEVLAAVCVLGSTFSAILTVRIKPVYELLYSGGSFRLPQSSGH